ncbi:hypothetical protein ASC90_19915 [Rhizobium sp. Root1220]|nr:hypothetical protein ASC90_19915 [Rhizobium sp. Root1220]
MERLVKSLARLVKQCSIRSRAQAPLELFAIALIQNRCLSSEFLNMSTPFADALAAQNPSYDLFRTLWH